MNRCCAGRAGSVSMTLFQGRNEGMSREPGIRFTVNSVSPESTFPLWARLAQ